MKNEFIKCKLLLLETNWRLRWALKQLLLGIFDLYVGHIFDFIVWLAVNFNYPFRTIAFHPVDYNVYAWNTLTISCEDSFIFVKDAVKFNKFFKLTIETSLVDEQNKGSLHLCIYSNPNERAFLINMRYLTINKTLNNT